MTFTVDIRGTELDVDYTYCPAHRGMRVGGQQMEPDEEAEIIIDAIKTKYGEDITELTSQRVDDEIMEAAMKHFTGLRIGAAEARADAQYEEMRLAA